MYKAKVKWNGNHYFAGEEVKGSKIEKREGGTTWLFDDKPTISPKFLSDYLDLMFLDGFEKSEASNDDNS